MKNLTELLSEYEQTATGEWLQKTPWRVIQEVDSLENQPPGAEGMLAIYRPLNPEHAGTLDDPIPFVNGMDVYTGNYYSYEGKTYLAKADMLPCVWNPGSEGVWQWEVVE